MDKSAVVLGWVVKATITVRSTHTRKGVVKDVIKKKVKVISERYTNREAAEIFCDIAKREFVPGTYSDVWVSEEMGSEE